MKVYRNGQWNDTSDSRVYRDGKWLPASVRVYTGGMVGDSWKSANALEDERIAVHYSGGELGIYGVDGTEHFLGPGLEIVPKTNWRSVTASKDYIYRLERPDLIKTTWGGTEVKRVDTGIPPDYFRVDVHCGRDGSIFILDLGSEHVFKYDDSLGLVTSRPIPTTVVKMAIMRSGNVALYHRDITENALEILCEDTLATIATRDVDIPLGTGSDIEFGRAKVLDFDRANGTISIFDEELNLLDRVTDSWFQNLDIRYNIRQQELGDGTWLFVVEDSVTEMATFYSVKFSSYGAGKIELFSVNNVYAIRSVRVSPSNRIYVLYQSSSGIRYLQCHKAPAYNTFQWRKTIAKSGEMVTRPDNQFTFPEYW